MQGVSMALPRASTSRLMTTLYNAGAYLGQTAKSTYEYMMDSTTKLNPHIPHLAGDKLIDAYYHDYGVAGVSMQCAAHLQNLDEKKEAHPGAILTSVAGKYYLYLRDPRLIEEVTNKYYDYLEQEEVGKLQKLFFGKNTINNTSRNHPSYPAKRHAVTGVTYDPLTKKDEKDTLSSPIQAVIGKYIEILKEYAQAGVEVDLNHFCARIAMTVISDTILGFKNFPESFKIRLTDVIHKIIFASLNPVNIAFINMGIIPPTIRKLHNEAVKIINDVIKLNEKDVLEKLSALLNKKLNKEDLASEDVLGLMKLFLVGGFESTSKTLFWNMIMLSDPKNKDFVEKIREEIATIPDLDKLTNQNFEEKDEKGDYKYKYSRAFILEILRVMPAFSEQRHQAAKEFTLSGNIRVPKGAIIVTSAYHAHRKDAKSFGDGPEQFYPMRWSDKKFSLKDTLPNPSLKTFGADSKRNCPGRLLAQFEAWKYLLGVVKNFNVISKTPDNPIPRHFAGFTLEVAEGPPTMIRLEPIKQQVELTERKEAKDERDYRTAEESQRKFRAGT